MDQIPDITQLLVAYAGGEHRVLDRLIPLVYEQLRTMARTRLVHRILIDYARSRKAGKRGGGVANLPLEETLWMPVDHAERLIELDEALEHLSAEHPRVSETLSFQYFAGYSNEEIARLLEVSKPTVERDQRFGRAWLASYFKHHQC